MPAASALSKSTPQVSRSAALSVAGTEAILAQKNIALRNWYRGLGTRKFTGTDVLFVGHSFIEGVNATFYDNTMVSAFRDKIRALCPTTGIAGGFGWKAGVGFATFSDDPLVKTSVTTNNNHGIGRRSMQVSAAGQKAVGTFTATGFDIYYSTTSGSTGVFYYKVDGGTAVTVSINATTSDNNRVQIRSLAAGTHTIEFGWSSGAAVAVGGIMVYNGDESSGIRVWNGGLGSSQTPDWLAAGASHWVDPIATIQPSLVVITLMLNDFGGSSYTPVASAATKANLKTLIANIRAKCTISPSFVICTEYQRQDNTSNAIEPWANYRALPYQIAAEDTGNADGTSGVVVFDMAKRFGAVPYPLSTAGLVSSDSVHPNQYGYNFWGESLAQYVAPV